jgi:hypothetical protein
MSVMTVRISTSVIHGDQAGPGAGLYVAGLGGLLVACGMGLLVLPGGVLRATAQRVVRGVTTTLSGSGRVVGTQLPAAERLEEALPRRERLEDALRRGVPATEVVQVAHDAVASALEADEPEVVAEIADRLDDEAIARGAAGIQLVLAARQARADLHDAQHARAAGVSRSEPVPIRRRGNAFAVWGFTAVLCGLLLLLLPVSSLALGGLILVPLGTVLSAIGRRNAKRDPTVPYGGLALAGLDLGLVGLAVTAIFGLALLTIWLAFR